MTEGLKIDVIHECKYFVSGLFIGILSSLYLFSFKILRGEILRHRVTSKVSQVSLFLHWETCTYQRINFYDGVKMEKKIFMSSLTISLAIFGMPFLIWFHLPLRFRKLYRLKWKYEIWLDCRLILDYSSLLGMIARQWYFYDVF